MDQPCRVVDFLANKGPPYVAGVGYPCFDVAGQSQSDKSKRDIGVMINVIITYKNRFVLPSKIAIYSQTYCTGMAKMSGASFLSILKAKTFFTLSKSSMRFLKKEFARAERTAHAHAPAGTNTAWGTASDGHAWTRIPQLVSTTLSMVSGST